MVHLARKGDASFNVAPDRLISFLLRLDIRVERALLDLLASLVCVYDEHSDFEHALT